MTKFLIEDETGHTTKDVPKQEVQQEIEQELVNGKWVTIEQKDGSNEILTEKDIPKPKNADIPTDEERKELQDWADKFKKTETATSTLKAKGG